MEKILIAFDRSPGAETAVRDLLRAGLPKRAEAKVLTIADVWVPLALDHGGDGFSGHTAMVAAYEQATELLEAAKNIALHGSQLAHQLFPEWNITHLAESGSPAWGIVEEAKKWRADLVVIGSHGRTPLEKFFLGSVSYKVVADAPCSVRVVRPRVDSGAPAVHLMIGLDGSDDAVRTVDEVAQRQWPVGTQIDLVTVIDPKLKSHVLFRKPPFADPAAFEKLEDTIQLSLEKAHGKLTRKELTVQRHALEGDPKQVLLQKAADWNVDCIFMGARGTEHGNRLYLGTLASAICTRAHCTVEIVRQSVPTPTEPHHVIREEMAHSPGKI